MVETLVTRHAPVANQPQLAKKNTFWEDLLIDWVANYSAESHYHPPL